mmetsp:Transcript_15674/g.43844  ORF Transcript_15674/g.43844 Transcript_15674/m.43844 type:complete len:229 (-) Transcript_15674:486-1172(-)
MSAATLRGSPEYTYSLGGAPPSSSLGCLAAGTCHLLARFMFSRISPSSIPPAFTALALLKSWFHRNSFTGWTMDSNLRQSSPASAGHSLPAVSAQRRLKYSGSRFLRERGSPLHTRSPSVPLRMVKWQSRSAPRNCTASSKTLLNLCLALTKRSTPSLPGSHPLQTVFWRRSQSYLRGSTSIRGTSLEEMVLLRPMQEDKQEGPDTRCVSSPFSGLQGHCSGIFFRSS